MVPVILGSRAHRTSPELGFGSCTTSEPSMWSWMTTRITTPGWRRDSLLYGCRSCSTRLVVISKWRSARTTEGFLRPMTAWEQRTLKPFRRLTVFIRNQKAPPAWDYISGDERVTSSGRSGHGCRGALARKVDRVLPVRLSVIRVRPLLSLDYSRETIPRSSRRAPLLEPVVC